MSVVTLTAAQLAEIVRGHDTVFLPVAVGGFVYAVVRDVAFPDIYRVAVA